MPRLSAAAHLAVLAREPRPAGEGAERRAREYCAEVLRSHGFSVEERRFDYSLFPGRFATPLVGLVSITWILAAALLGVRGAAWSALLTLVSGALLVTAGTAWIARRGVLDMPVLRAHSVNLVAQRGTPTVWLLAHLDSKSQPIPIIVRAAGITLTVLVWLAAIGLAGLQVLGANVIAGWVWVATAAILAAAPVAASVVGAKSPGAADNASGVAAVLTAVERAPREHGLGVLLTSAEELGLAGARAWARESTSRTAVNVDTVDDHGVLRGLFTGRAPTALLRDMAAAAKEAGVPFRPQRLFPGILVDGVALADAGWQVVTLSKGTAGTLARVHTPRDDLDRLQGHGSLEAAGVIDAFLRSRI